MAFRLNQGGEAVRAGAEAEPGKKEDLKPGEEVFRANNKGRRFQEKKGSVFPVKKKLIKTMMVECLVESLSSVSISPEASLSSKMGGSSKMSTTPSKASKGKKSVEIFPDP